MALTDVQAQLAEAIDALRKADADVQETKTRYNQCKLDKVAAKKSKVAPIAVVCALF